VRIIVLYGVAGTNQQAPTCAVAIVYGDPPPTSEWLRIVSEEAWMVLGQICDCHS